MFTLDYIVPPEYCEAMRPLMAANYAHPYEDIVKVLEQDLGGPVEAFYAHIDPQPIACGSLAQVCALPPQHAPLPLPPPSAC